MVHKITRETGIGKEISQCLETESNEHKTEYSQFQLIYMYIFHVHIQWILHDNNISTFPAFSITCYSDWNEMHAMQRYMVFFRVCMHDAHNYSSKSSHLQFLIFCCEWYVQYYFIRSTSSYSNLFWLFVFWFDWIEHSVWWLTVFFFFCQMERD